MVAAPKALDLSGFVVGFVGSSGARSFLPAHYYGRRTTCRSRRVRHCSTTSRLRSTVNATPLRLHPHTPSRWNRK